MQTIAIIAALITLLGAIVLPLIDRTNAHRTRVLTEQPRIQASQSTKVAWRVRSPSANWILYGFAIVVLLFGIGTVIWYWKDIRQNIDTVFFCGWLFLTMTAGMFVQVITSNYTANRSLFSVTLSQLIYPLLFSVVVYYPIWVTATASPRGLFSFYAAFLNGYFWQNVVSKATLRST